MMSATVAKLKCPFPYFGGKARVAQLVWRHIGDVTNWIEPFAGSLAVTLARPAGHQGKVETVNDWDCYLANFWRATKLDPEAVAHHANDPVNEVDLYARHLWLIRSCESQAFREVMRADPDYFDAKIAGWWVWGISCWIGSGWCEAGVEWEQMPKLSEGTGNGVHRKRPQLGHPDNRGVNATGGKPWHRFRKNATHTGVHGRPQLADAYSRGRGVHSNDALDEENVRLQWLTDWFGVLRDRLRCVRVCCGDWKRVCNSPSVTTRLGLTGLFLDPPYPTQTKGKQSRDKKIYTSDSNGTDLDQLRDEILKYCKDRGGDKLMRIAVCGYEGDGYEELEAQGWRVEAWKSSGYGNRSEGGKANTERERIWFSPHCQFERTLFDGEDA